MYLVQFSRSVVSESLRPHESQHARPPCPSQTPGVYSNSCPLSRWCHPAISSSVVPFSSCPQSLPASRSFPMFAWGGQSIVLHVVYSFICQLDLGWFYFLTTMNDTAIYDTIYDLYYICILYICICIYSVYSIWSILYMMIYIYIWMKLYMNDMGPWDCKEISQS